MGFDRRDIRRGMDVYTLDNVYLGSVLRVIPGPQAPSAWTYPDELRQTGLIDGELLGPMPTQMIGNRGPRTQSARGKYATQTDDRRPIGRGALVVGRQFLPGRRTIPLDAVLSVSLERVVLKYRANELPAA